MSRQKYPQDVWHPAWSMWVLAKKRNLKCMEPEASLWEILPVIRNAKLQVEDLVLINA